jgi:TonB family protein
MNFCLTNLLKHLVLFAALFLIVGSAAKAQQPGSDTPKEEIPRAGLDGVTMPKCRHCPKLNYTQEARQKKCEGVVVLMVVVTREGNPADIQVKKSLGLGLDEKAIEAVRQWTFKPAKKDGRPVTCLVPVEITFRLH